VPDFRLRWPWCFDVQTRTSSNPPDRDFCDRQTPKTSNRLAQRSVACHAKRRFLDASARGVPSLPTSSLRSPNDKACRQGVFPATGSWAFKVRLLNLLIWTRTLVISRLDTKGGHEAQQAAAPQVHRSKFRKELRHLLLRYQTQGMESSSVHLYHGSHSGHQLN
jgi:hypothetical protein